MVNTPSKLLSLLNIKHPIVLAPMGGVSGGKLAGAVSKAGGLGLVGASYGDPDWMKTELGIMADVDAPWGVGLVMFTLAKRPELLDLALSYAPSVVALSFGDPTPFVDLIKRTGALVLVQIHDVSQALEAVRSGADALIVQGSEAGGHSLYRATFPLVPAVRDAVGKAIPIIAAGGIADGRGLAASFALGADGAMLGTRFVATHEALPSAKVKAKVVSAVASETIRTRAFDIVRGIDWPEGYAGRALANKFSDAWLGREDTLKTASQSVRDAYAQAIGIDDVDVRAIWAGEAADLVRDVRPASDLVAEIAAEARATLQKLINAVDASHPASVPH